MFNVGDVVINFGIEYVVDAVDPWGEYHVHRRSDGESIQGYHPEDMFTLVTPATPVLTGMTQFFKDKEKSNVT